MDGARSDSYNLMRRVDIRRLSSGDAIAPAGFRKVGSGGHAITVSAPLHVIGSRTLVVRNSLSTHT